MAPALRSLRALGGRCLFVLSGYVISFVSSIKETSFEQFAVSRLARVYSVALPAVFLTPCLDLIGRSYYPLAYEGWPRSIGLQSACTPASVLQTN